jgi:hypothetical protein
MAAGESRVTRKRICHNYIEPSLADIYVVDPAYSKPPKKKARTDDVYPIRIVEEDSSSHKYKVHYIGYSKQYDEWKSEGEIISIGEEAQDENPDPKLDCLITERYSHHRELAYRIKMALNSSRKDSPVVRINMPFDRVEFDSGLRMCGVQKRCFRGIQRYSINQYRDLNEILGDSWHFRGLNTNGDFCYVLLNTIEFYLYHRRRLTEYVPSQSPTASQAIRQYREVGDGLIFLFVKGDGTPDKFGTDVNIFDH